MPRPRRRRPIPPTPPPGFPKQENQGLLAVLERRRRVAYTIDLSYNLGNSSHFDVNDASQGTVVGQRRCLAGENWYFIMPNVEGKRPNGTKFTGLAIKLGHGIAISWDGRIVRHCTSVSCPDGLDSGYVGVAKDSTSFVNTLYGVFTCAKKDRSGWTCWVCCELSACSPTRSLEGKGAQ
ncbi:hypothetical protein MHU86_21468 [Fragilaria crotonensis]|nr:hypothetical protein MHU86_21468 [Fragilaria crotonensis]